MADQALTREMGFSSEVEYLLGSRNDAVAAVLLGQEQAAERLRLLQEANALRSGCFPRWTADT
jgi:hypothetical protein